MTEVTVHLADGDGSACGVKPGTGVYGSLSIRNVNCPECIARWKAKHGA